MCKCTPQIRTPYCGKPGCEAPASSNGIVARLRSLHLKILRGESALIGSALQEAADEIEAARRTAAYWKDEKLAADAEIERLKREHRAEINELQREAARDARAAAEQARWDERESHSNGGW